MYLTSGLDKKVSISISCISIKDSAFVFDTFKSKITNNSQYIALISKLKIRKKACYTV